MKPTVQNAERAEPIRVRIDRVLCAKCQWVVEKGRRCPDWNSLGPFCFKLEPSRLSAFSCSHLVVEGIGLVSSAMLSGFQNDFVEAPYRRCEGADGLL